MDENTIYDPTIKLTGRSVVPTKQETEKKKVVYRVSMGECILMVGVCFLFFDLTQVVLEWLLIGFVLNWIITIIAGGVMWFWFQMKGITFVSPAKLLSFVIPMLIDFIPGNNFSIIFGFTWTTSTIILLVLSRIEDRTGVKVPLPSLPKKI